MIMPTKFNSFFNPSNLFTSNSTIPLQNIINPTKPKQSRPDIYTFTWRANSTSFCLCSSDKISNKSAYMSLLILLAKTSANLPGDFANFKDWTACMASGDNTLDLHIGFLGPIFLDPHVTFSLDGGIGRLGKERSKFRCKPTWGMLDFSESMNEIRQDSGGNREKQIGLTFFLSFLL